MFYRTFPRVFQIFPLFTEFSQVFLFSTILIIVILHQFMLTRVYQNNTCLKLMIFLAPNGTHFNRIQAHKLKSCAEN